MNKTLIRTCVAALFVVAACTVTLHAQQVGYPALSQSTVIIKGNSGAWDANKVHTLSVVKADRDGYKYWGYYGLAYYGGDPALRKAGLVRSNDLVHWTKFKGNPIIGNDCRWPTVVLSHSVFYMFYEQYNANNDSRIVMVTSKDGIHFGNKVVVVPLEIGMQNQNPFIYFDKRSKEFCLFYYNGIEKSSDSTSNYWSIMLRESPKIDGLRDVNPSVLLFSRSTLASPSVALFNNRYYLLTEARRIEGAGPNQYTWITTAYSSKQIDGAYSMVRNNPVLSNNDACAFQYVFGGQLYIFYSHCLNLPDWNWELKMVKALR